MGNLVWAGSFLLLILIVSALASAAMIGMPIAGAVQLGVVCMTFLLAWSGFELLTAAQLAPLPLKPAIV